MYKNLFELENWDDVTEHQKIGEILMSSGKITLLHLSMALDVQKFQKLPLGVIFVIMKIISKSELEQALIVQNYIDKRIADGVF